MNVGEENFATGKITIDISKMAPAVYTLVAKGKDFVVNKKLMIEAIKE